MRFERLDLNLLVTLSALIEDQSVSMAAKRLHLSQSAVSGALSRLREFFGDELLVQSGRQMVLTAKAEELAAPVADALMLIRTRITTPARFDPATAERTFRVVTSDYVFTVLLAGAMAELAGTAPGIAFEVLFPEQRTMELLERGEVDLLITIDSHVREDFPQTHLFDDEHAVISWAGSAHSAGVSVESFRAAGHAIAYFGPARAPASSEIFFEEQGIERRADVLVPSFALLPQAVIGTERLATLQRRYAEHCARSLPITVHPAPFAMPRLREIAQWHPRRAQDNGLQWLVEAIRERAARLQASILID